MQAAFLSRENRTGILHNEAMATADNSELIFNNQLCARTKALREGHGWTGEQMATALGIPVERYRKYETRSPIPAYLMERFCLIVACDLDYLLTGRRSNRALQEAIQARRA